MCQLDDKTKNTILELIAKAKELDLGNVSFWLFTKKEGETKIYLTEYTGFWEVVIRNEKMKDIYKISENEMVYQFTEKN